MTHSSSRCRLRPSSLYFPRRVDIMGTLRRLARETGQAILLSIHDLDLALRSADTIWLLAPGGGFHIGVPEDLILNGAFQAALTKPLRVGIEDRHQL